MYTQTCKDLNFKFDIKSQLNYNQPPISARIYPKAIRIIIGRRFYSDKTTTIQMKQNEVYALSASHQAQQNIEMKKNVVYGMSTKVSSMPKSDYYEDVQP